MPAPKSSSSGGSEASSPGKPTKAAKPSAKRAPGSAAPTRAGAKRAPGKVPPARAEAGSADDTAAAKTDTTSGVADGEAGVEQLTDRIIKPLDLVMLTRERIQDTLDEAAERGRVTRADANELVSELIKRGRQQTDEMLGDIEKLVGRGREQLESASRRARRTDPVDRLVRGADRARRTVGVGPSFPILGYDALTARQVQDRLSELTVPELRKVRDHERRHANRKSVLAATEKALA